MEVDGGNSAQLRATPVIVSPRNHHSRSRTNKASTMPIIHTNGDLLSQPVEVIVNAWNRNIIPWWLLLPQGVSGAIKKKAGTQPFREVARHGPIPLGGAVLTSAGRLPFRGIIHVAGINMLWRSSEFSVRESVRSAMKIAIEHRFASIAFPLIGAGSGGGSQENIQNFITEELTTIDFSGDTYIVQYQPNG
jgi:O-acetyl-ADP-ribose deacetylase (regulator of RNase III)